MKPNNWALPFESFSPIRHPGGLALRGGTLDPWKQVTLTAPGTSERVLLPKMQEEQDVADETLTRAEDAAWLIKETYQRVLGIVSGDKGALWFTTGPCTLEAGGTLYAANEHGGAIISHLHCHEHGPLLQRVQAEAQARRVMQHDAIRVIGSSYWWPARLIAPTLAHHLRQHGAAPEFLAAWDIEATLHALGGPADALLRNLARASHTIPAHYRKTTT